jgi:hypothetical protein
MRSGDNASYQNLGVDRTFHLSSTLTLASLFKNFADGLANYKTMATVFRSIEDGINKIGFNSVTFDYNAKMALRNDNMSSQLMKDSSISTGKFLAYQFGLSGIRWANAWDVLTGEMPDGAFGGMGYRRTLNNLEQNDSRTKDIVYSLTTNFKLPDPIDISFNGISLKWTGNSLVRPDTSVKEETVTFPDFSCSATSGILNKISFLNQQVEGLQLSCSYNWLERLRISGKNSDLEYTSSWSHRFSPLVGVMGTLKKWPVNLNYNFGAGWKNESSKTSKNETKSSDFSHKIDIKYEISKSGGISELKIFMWTLPVKGRLVTGAETEYTINNTTTTTATTGNPTSTEATSYMLTPHATYDFTDNITGQLSYTFTNKKAISQTTTSHIFQLSVEIRFNP